jgi:meiotically up-regulated gene 157 (Mug157) protein
MAGPRFRWATAIAGLIFLAWTGVGAPANALELDAISKAAAHIPGGAATAGQIYAQCLLSTVRNDVTFQPDQTTYVITGDIGAMWLRDASAQVRPYLFFASDPMVRALLRGVVAREAKNILTDPYANAFNRDYKVAEEKYELDSLLYPISLAWTYWKETGDASIFSGDVRRAYDKALGLMEVERDHSLSRYRHPELANNGGGNAVGYTGMIWTGFRPSDDAAQYGYNIPEEMFAVVALTELSDLEASVWRDRAKHDEVTQLRDGIARGITTYGIVYSPKFGYVYAYEVDGLGHANLMDDANVPSLLSAPYLGYVPVYDPIYQNTRRMVLSNENPYFFAGRYATAIGSPHTPKEYGWPLAIVMQGLTSVNHAEVNQVIKELESSDTGDHLLHESFNVNDPTKFTRSNFGWPCSLYSELVLTGLLGYQHLPTAPFDGSRLKPAAVGSALH